MGHPINLQGLGLEINGEGTEEISPEGGSWAMEVQTSGRPEWSGNAVRFGTESEAVDAGAELASRWFLVDAWRAVRSADPVNYVMIGGRPHPIARGEIPGDTCAWCSGRLTVGDPIVARSEASRYHVECARVAEIDRKGGGR